MLDFLKKKGYTGIETSYIFVNKLEEMLLKNGVIYHNSDGSTSYIEGSLLSNSLVVRNSSGWVTHRIELAANGVDIIVRNTSTGLVEMRFAA
ncbi:hypothetical protein J6X04_03545 [Candidatus Saccharibacteria bacterium]|nr:hypothetical protein [Candidatus Saccharibacteria bacterium]